MDAISIEQFATQGLVHQPALVLSTMTSPKDFLTIQMPKVVKNRAADERMLRQMTGLGWTVLGTVDRVAYLSRPHQWKDVPSGWAQATAARSTK